MPNFLRKLQVIYVAIDETYTYCTLIWTCFFLQMPVTYIAQFITQQPYTIVIWKTMSHINIVLYIYIRLSKRDTWWDIVHKFNISASM